MMKHGLTRPKFTKTVGIEYENELRGPFEAKNHRQRPVCCCRCCDCGRTSRWLVVDVEAVLVVGTVPKFSSTLFRNVGDTARFYTGPHLQKRTALASDVLTRSFIKWEWSVVYTYVDLLVNSRFRFICLKIAKFKNCISIILAHDIILFIEKRL
jgi:hypothetical protein